MSLNIKSDRVHEMARHAARRTGLSQTSVIEAALTRYLKDLDHEAQHRDDRVAQLLSSFDHQLSDQDRAEHRVDDLYDEAGLPQ